MRYLFFVAVLMLPQIGFSFHIPHQLRSSISTDNTCCHLENPKSIATRCTRSSPETSASQNLRSNALSMSKRGPTPVLFKMGRKKNHYELNGERGTDHLYDIKDENALGNEIVEKKAEDLMGQIWHRIEGPTKSVQCICV